MVPSPLVEKRSDPYHGSVLPLNYEGSGIDFPKKSNRGSIGKSSPICNYKFFLFAKGVAAPGALMATRMGVICD
ncbi:MAG: hypothetical protein K6B65_00815, partial [Bacilli bacterium]|nr:hypothetical protein [Bacilli bacterium]